MGSLVGKFVEWTFALIAVFWVWRLDLSKLLNNLANILGAKDEGWIRRIIVNGGVPFALTLVVVMTLWVYQLFIWPLNPTSNYQGGWWVYALVSDRGKRPANSVGFFRIVHTPQEIRIVEGHAYYVKTSGFERRRFWDADTVWVRPEKMRLIFTMQAIDPPAEVLPSHYDGFMELRRVKMKPLLGNTAWSGYFNDLKDRRDVVGPVYAERLRRRLMQRNTEELEKLLHEFADDLLKRARGRKM